MKTFLAIFLAVWLAVFTASLAAYAVVYEDEPVYTDGGVTWPIETPSPWVES